MSLLISQCCSLRATSIPSTSQPFADNSHTLYYGKPKLAQATRPRSVQCQAVGSGRNSGRPDRRERVRRKASLVAETISRLEMDGQLASYDLQLPSSASFSYETSTTSSSSSESSDSEAEISPRFPSSRRVPTAAPVATISVCQGKACSKRGSGRVLATLEDTTPENVQVTSCKCLGQCKRAPAVKVNMPSGEEIIYVGVHDGMQLASVVLQ